MSERRHKSDAEYLDEANEAIRELVEQQANRICRNCRWWGGDTIRAPKDWAGCELADSDNGRKHKQSLAKAMDAEMYHAVLQTAPDFGCVQWEGRE